jgi:AraC family transcriptional regulator
VPDAGIDASRRPAADDVFLAAHFIEASLGRPVSLRDIAARSRWSLQYFHRVFRARVGLPVMDYVRRRRLTIAARRLIDSDASIIDLAFDAGFNSQAAFTRAFTRVYHRPPAAYRRHGRDVPWRSVSAIAAETLASLPGLGIASPHRVVRPALRVVGLERTLSAHERDSIPAIWRELERALQAQHVEPQLAYGVVRAVPRGSDGLLAYAAAVALDRRVTLARDLTVRSVPAGRYLVFPFLGPRKGLPPAIDFIYGTWIPGSGQQLRRAPMLEVYSAPFAKRDTFAVELWIPIA